MTAKEYLLEEFRVFHSKKKQKSLAFYANPSTARIDPFKIADGLYYVGDKKVCIHLIDTGDGLILLDSGYLGAGHLLVDSIWRAGFDPKNVSWIIHTHGHWDHFGASEEFRRMYGTKLAISRVDGEILKQKPKYAHVDNHYFPFGEVPEFDRFIEDGEIFELGNVKIRCLLTPGHTQGVLSFFFPVMDNGQTYLAGMFGGAGVNTLSLPAICYDEDPKDCPQQMLASIEKILNEPVVVHLGNHPSNNQTLKKREQQIHEGGNPFVDPNSWRDFLTKHKGTVQKVIEENKALELKMKELFGEEADCW